MKAIIPLILLVISCSVYGYHEARKLCVVEMKISMEEAMKFEEFWKNDHAEVPDDLRCFVGCIADKSGFWDNHQLNLTALEMKGDELNIPLEIRLNTRACLEEVGTGDSCTLGPQIAKCVKDNGAADYLDH